MIQIYDANAYLRRSLSKTADPLSAFDPRLIYNRANATALEFWVWDGVRHNDRRRTLFPGYKIRDQTGQENVFAGLELYRELLNHSRAIQIEVPEWEADDVCGTLAKMFSSRGERCIVHTNDFDFHQLASLPGVKVSGIKPLGDVPAYLLAVFKAAHGDSSDKIPGIPGFGIKSWEAMAPHHDDLLSRLQAHDVEGIRALPWAKRHATWLADDENARMFIIYFEITQMFDVPIPLIEQHMMQGQFNPAAAEQIFARFLW